MKEPIFKNTEHENFYKKHTSKDTENEYLKAFIYAIGIDEDAREHISDIFDLENEVIMPSGLKKPWQTLASINITKLAFNLYNDFCYDVDALEKGEAVVDESFMPSALFCTADMIFMFQAVELRFAKDVLNL